MKQTKIYLKYISAVFILCVFSCQKLAPSPKKNKLVSGQIFGTYFNITYDGKPNYKTQFDSIFSVINQSLSTYQKDSDISKINRNESVNIDNHFKQVFKASKQIYNSTKGVFDPTIGAVVNAWDFGPQGEIKDLNRIKIDSLMQYVGLKQVNIKQNQIVKPPNTFLDFNAIAKGYALDQIAAFLNSKVIPNYLIDIGGEIVAKGINIESKKQWSAGIATPRLNASQPFIKAIYLNNEAMATSGTYLKFKIDDNGNRYAHIIDAKTGYPTKTNILSVSVIASNCMFADAYATAFQAMGIANVKEFLKTHPELKAFIIFENSKNELETLSLNNFPD